MLIKLRLIKILLVGFTVSIPILPGYAFEVDQEEYVDSDEISLQNQYAYGGHSKRNVEWRQGRHHRGDGGGGGKRAATGNRVFIYNPNTLVWRAYDSNGTLVRSGHGSGGRRYCPDVGRRCKTPIGTFHVYSKAGPHFISSRFPLPHGGAPMPYAMFFHRGFAIHGSNDVPGYNASHGCIRVYPSDARWLNTQFLNYGATVIVNSY